MSYSSRTSQLSRLSEGRFSIADGSRTVPFRVEDIQSLLNQRYCDPKQQIVSRTYFFEYGALLSEIEEACDGDIQFYEQRGYYQFAEPVVEPHPSRHQFRVRLVFKKSRTGEV